MSVSCQEELLSKALMLKVNINNGIDEHLEESTHINSSNINMKFTSSSTNSTSYGSPPQTIASIFAPTLSNMTAIEAAHRLHELELQLLTEQETVAKLKRQLSQCLQMLSDLRSVHNMCPVKTHFDDLPEELIVSIFSYLDVEELVDVVSNVSQKWNRLAHDLILWSQMSLKNHDLGAIIKLMNFAPCLRCVCISSEQLYVHDDTDDKSLQVLTRSPCRVRSLTLPDFQPISLRIIRNQQGHLRHLQLNSWWDHMRADYRDELWRAVAELDLTSLTLHEYDGGNSYFHSPFRPLPGQLSGLRHLDLYCKKVPGDILGALLRACKNSLETVSLPPKARGEHVALLSQCPRLREANVPFLREVCALENNPLLDFVEMNAEWVPEPEVEAIVSDVVRFLRMPAVVGRLRTLFFQGMPVKCRQLLHAVSGVRGLRFVRIHNFGEAEAVEGVLDVLEGLPHLERFTIAALPPPPVLDCISADSCPRLRELCLIGVCCEDQHGCRIPAVKRLLRHRPRLHVFLDLGLGVSRHLEGAFPECLREHRHVCADESRWHRFHPVLVNHEPDDCSWCRTKVEPYATVVCMLGKLDE